MVLNTNPDFVSRVSAQSHTMASNYGGAWSILSAFFGKLAPGDRTNNFLAETRCCLKCDALLGRTSRGA